MKRKTANIDIRVEPHLIEKIDARRMRMPESLPDGLTLTELVYASATLAVILATALIVWLH